MTTLDTIHHMALNVADVRKSVQWYQSSFSCEILFEDKSMAVLQFANVRLALILPSHEPSHLAMERENAATFGELRERNEGLRSTFVSDPTGNIIELVSTHREGTTE